MITVPLLQFEQETIFWSRIDAAIFMVASAYEHALWIEAAAHHHECQRLAAVASIIHKVAQKNHVTVLTRQTQSTVKKSLAHEQHEHADKRLGAAV